jgi:protein TonB
MNLPALPLAAELSPLRIGAFSAALCLHLLAFALLAVPPRAAPLRPVAPMPDVLIAEFIAQVVSKPPPAPPPPLPPRRPAPQPRTTVAPDVVPVILDTAVAALPVTMPEPAPDAAPQAETTGSAPAPAFAQIAYAEAPPPPYPARARQRGWEGTVLLRVRVDERGIPREVRIERSSGHALLDRSASEHVLRRWRFQPAQHDGRAAVAWARVPIGFRIERG